MSYILDALKKIEHDKNTKKTSNGRTNLSGELFREQKKTLPRIGVRTIALLVMVAVLATGAATWLALRGKHTRSAPAIRVAAVPVTVPPPLPPSAAPAPAPPPLPPAAPAALPVAPSPVIHNNVETVGDEDAERAPRRSKRRAGAPSASAGQLPGTAPTPAEITLSGIAWQDERPARRAVVNGFLLKEGSVVSGATITDIKADRVRFSSSAGVFEIKLNSILPNEVR